MAILYRMGRADGEGAFRGNLPPEFGHAEVLPSTGVGRQAGASFPLGGAGSMRDGVTAALAPGAQMSGEAG